MTGFSESFFIQCVVEFTLSVLIIFYHVLIFFCRHDNSEELSGGPLHNRVTHWWDASQIYGSSKMEENLIRAADGKIHLDSNDELDYDKDGTPLTGFGDNFWVGLHVFHTIFAREHNYIIDSLSVVYPGMTSDEKYGVARLCVSAILAKIHTVGKMLCYSFMMS